MKRRNFFILGAGVGVSFFSWGFLGSSVESTIEKVIRKRLDYLTLEATGLRRYAKDIYALHVISQGRIRALSALGPIYTNFHLSSGTNTLAYAIRHGEDRIVASYLISSDFFVNGADQSKVVHYLGLLDSRRACGNPFARSAASDGSAH